MDDLTRGQRARDILADETYQESRQLAIQAICEEWLTESSQANRERLWLEVQALKRPDRALTKMAGDALRIQHRELKHAG